MATARYEVLSQTIEVLLSPGSALFDVPIFQRSYAWGAEEIGQLMDDVFGEADRAELPYFLGSVVLAAKDESSTGRKGDLVLDGQQRLTTISLLIAALIFKMKQAGDEDAIENNTYLFSKAMKGKKSPKLTLQKEDAAAFEALLTNPDSRNEQKYKTSRVSFAFNRLILDLEKYANENTEFSKEANPYQKMLQRLLYDVELVRITAPSERDAFRLFETLNDRGLSLSAADLIKNKLFSQCGGELEDAVEAWTGMLGMIADDDVVNYLRAYWISFHGFARKRRLYDYYRGHIEKLSPVEAALFAIKLDDTSRAYNQIIAPNPKGSSWRDDVVEILERLELLRAKSCRPVLLALSRSGQEEMLCGAQICESIAIRYSLVGEKNPNVLEAIYSDICKTIRDSSDPWQDILGSRHLLEIPDDEEFREKLLTVSVSTINSGWREFLSKLNAFNGTGETKIQRGGRVHVEHILSQTPRASALSEAGLSQEEAGLLIYKIGNLTLLSGKKNKQASNRPFSEKVAHYSSSEIAMTRRIGELVSWSKSQIDERTKEMADLAVTAFPHPRNIILSYQSANRDQSALYLPNGGISGSKVTEAVNPS